jgi:hypothetical protein
VRLNYEFYTVLNHGAVKLLKSGISWNPPKKDYKPNWDFDNLAAIWNKIGNDTLVLQGVLLDDNVGIIKENNARFVEIKELFDAKIVLTINY